MEKSYLVHEKELEKRKELYIYAHDIFDLKDLYYKKMR